jgi:glycerol-3-phosphate cytidylyltransferase
MIRIGYAPGAFDLFHIGHLNLLRRAKERCDYLVAGVVSDEVLIAHKGVTPVVPLVERIEIVRNCRYVDAAHAAMTDDKLEIWRDLRFNVFFKGDDWRGTEKGICLERQFAELDCESAYDLTPKRLPTVTLVGRPINSSIQCVAVRGLGSDLDANRASDPTPNNSSRVGVDGPLPALFVAGCGRR